MTVVGGAQKVCEWCGKPLNERQEVACSTPCRLRRWHWLNGLPVGKQGVPRPPKGSVLLMGPWARERHERAQNSRSNGANGGLQVSVGRMLLSLQGPPAYLNEQSAREHIAKALSERQRDRFLGSAA